MAVGKSNAGGGGKRGFKYGEKVTVSEATGASFIKHGYGQQRFSLGDFSSLDFKRANSVFAYVAKINKILARNNNNNITFIDPQTLRVTNSVSTTYSLSAGCDFVRGRLFAGGYGYFDLVTRNFVRIDDGNITWNDKYILSLKYVSSQKYKLRVYTIEAPHNLVYSKDITLPNSFSSLLCCIHFNLDTKKAIFIGRDEVTIMDVSSGEIVKSGSKNVWYQSDYRGFSTKLKYALFTAGNYNSTTSFKGAFIYDVENERIVKSFIRYYDDKAENPSQSAGAVLAAFDEDVFIAQTYFSTFNSKETLYFYHLLDGLLVDFSISEPVSDRRYKVETYNNDYRLPQGNFFVKDKKLHYPYGENYGTSLQLTNTLTWYEK